LPTARNRSTIEDTFIKATRIENLALGLVYFLTGPFSEQSYEDEEIADLVKWASGLALETLRTGVDVIPTL
jgi:nucleolar MIF4G domain-containing protein 1